jgi:hypothetical protein
VIRTARRRATAASPDPITTATNRASRRTRSSGCRAAGGRRSKCGPRVPGRPGAVSPCYRPWHLHRRITIRTSTPVPKAPASSTRSIGDVSRRATTGRNWRCGGSAGRIVRAVHLGSAADQEDGWTAPSAARRRAGRWCCTTSTTTST